MGKSKAERDVKKREKASSELAALLKQHQDEIATAWAELVKSSPSSLGYPLPVQDVRSLTLWGLRSIAGSLETGSRVLLEEYLAGICPAGSEAVPDAAAVTEALLLCKEAAVPVIREALGADSSNTWALISELDACLRWMVGRLTSLFAADMNRRLQREHDQVAMVLDIAQTASSTLELGEVVRRVAEGIVAALGVDTCAFDLVDEELRSAVSLTQLSDWSSRVVRSFDSYGGLWHEALRTREPVASYDVQADPRFGREPAGAHRLKSMLGVPLVVKGKVAAVAWVATIRDYRRFSREDIALALGMGNILGLVIQNAQLFEHSRQLTVMEERARLAREIHDGIAQTLGALQLKASQLEDSLLNQKLDESRGHLSELQEMISRAYRDLREAMFGLRAVVEPGAGLVTALREYLTRYQAQCGLEVRLEVDQGEPATLDGRTQAQTMRILQEALSNVRRHARTDAATLRIERSDDAVRISVVDRGQGFEPALLEGQNDGRHLGLHTMRERAESVGGTLIVESGPGQGTRVVLQLPLYEDGGPE